MESVYESNLAVDAHMIRDLLERTGISARVEGEHLQSGFGELPMALVRVVVDPERAEEARSVIADWEKRTPAAPARSQSRWSWAPFTFVIGGAVGFGAAWLIFNTPVTSAGADFDGDGVLDEIYHYAGQRTTLVELDRNADGRVDGRWEYDTHGVPSGWAGDDDFDGRFESTGPLERGQLSSDSIDRDGDGRPNTIARYENGVLVERELLDPKTGRVAKRQQYAGDRLLSAEIDADGDGRFERQIAYDELEEPTT